LVVRVGISLILKNGDNPGMKQLAELEVTDNKKLVLLIGEFRGAERIDLRKYVKVNGEYIPTKSGINFNAEWLDDFLKMVEKLRDE
jgi:hypothetical protein